MTLAYKTWFWYNMSIRTWFWYDISIQDMIFPDSRVLMFASDTGLHSLIPANISVDRLTTCDGWQHWQRSSSSDVCRTACWTSSDRQLALTTSWQPATHHQKPFSVNNQRTHSLPLIHPQFPLATDRNGLSLALAACSANTNYSLPKPGNAKYNLYPPFHLYVAKLQNIRAFSFKT